MIQHRQVCQCLSQWRLLAVPGIFAPLRIAGWQAVFGYDEVKAQFIDPAEQVLASAILTATATIGAGFLGYQVALGWAGKVKLRRDGGKGRAGALFNIAQHHGCEPGSASAVNSTSASGAALLFSCAMGTGVNSGFCIRRSQRNAYVTIASRKPPAMA